EVPLRNGRRYGVVRTWHKNGVLASEEPYQNGLPHGICRRWGEAGRLLGKYKMVHGTGVQRAWHDNGQLQVEVSTLHGEFCGRNRIWLCDGTLLSERFYLHGEVVSADRYREAAAKNKALPKYRATPATVHSRNGPSQKQIHRVFVASLLENRNRCEARKWLRKEASNQTVRSLGRFKRETDMAAFVENLYKAGAIEVIVPSIYPNKASDQFADCLLVRLPKNPAKRKAIRRVCMAMQKHELGAVQPGEDIGEKH